MAWIARVVVPGLPHHVTQRGNRRQRTFFRQADHAAYTSLLATWCREREVAVWAYCLMPNHVHLILVPSSADGLRRALGEAHRRYTRGVNARLGWVGHLWQGRFASFPLDGEHPLAAVRYVELNPVRAGLVTHAGAWPWGSARAHLAGRDDGLVSVAPLLEAVGDWRAFLGEGPSEREQALLRRHERTGRPLGGAGFVAQIEQRLGRRLRPGRPGPRRPERDGNG